MARGFAADSRLKKPRTLGDKYHPWAAPRTLKEWNAVSKRVRLQLRVATGLWPAWPRGPIKSVIYGKVDRGDYTVEKVYFASLPGHYVTGSLYRPKGGRNAAGTRRPGILCPHGHWRVSKELSGRFYDRGVTAAQKEIDSGAEEILETARNPIQARCVHLARMGCVVFQYDMLAYADSNQLGYDVVHGFDSQRAHMNTPTGWGLFSWPASVRIGERESSEQPGGVNRSRRAGQRWAIRRDPGHRGEPR